MSSNAASGSKGESSKRKADEPGSTIRDGKKAKVKPLETAVAPTAAAAAVDEDDEWARFQQEVLSAAAEEQEADGAQQDTAVNSLPTSVYANATIEAQPELRRPTAEGEAPVKDPGEETEAQKRKRLAKEEREEILARLEEEQRLQDEAEERVSSLKSRLERIKAARAASKPTSTPKTNGSGSGSKTAGKASSEK